MRTTVWPIAVEAALKIEGKGEENAEGKTKTLSSLFSFAFRLFPTVALKADAPQSESGGGHRRLHCVGALSQSVSDTLQTRA